MKHGLTNFQVVAACIAMHLQQIEAHLNVRIRTKADTGLGTCKRPRVDGDRDHSSRAVGFTKDLSQGTVTAMGRSSLRKDEPLFLRDREARTSGEVRAV